MSEANTIVENLLAKYRLCSSYKDKGIAQGGQGTISFKTYFSRPDRFKFAWQNHDRKTEYKLIVEAGQSVLRTNFQSDQHFSSIHSALCACSGISQRSAWIIPPLLMPELIQGSAHFSNESGYECMSQGQSAEFFECWHLHNDSPNRSTDLWIRKEDFSLHSTKHQWVTELTSDRLAVDMLAENEPSLVPFAENLLLSQNARDRQNLTSVSFESVEFDSNIPDNAFS